MSDEDSDATIVEPFEIQSIIAKYKLWSSEENPGSSTVGKDSTDDKIRATTLSDCEDEGPTPAKKSCEAKNAGPMDEVDAILEELSAKYNLNFDVTTESYDSTSKIGDTKKKYTQTNSQHSCDTKAGNYDYNPDYTDRRKQSEFSAWESDDEMRVENVIAHPNPHTNLGARVLSSDKHVSSQGTYRKQLGDHLAKHEDDRAPHKDHLENIVELLEPKKPVDLKKKLQLERQKKKEEAERDKEIKKALNAANKNIKPDECIKFITAIIDERIMEQPFSAQLERHVRELGASSRGEAQIIPNTITWVRKTQSHSMGDGGKLELSSSTEECEQIVLVLTWRECLNLIHAGNLLTHVQQLKSKQISIVIYGMEEYFKYLKRKKRNQIHDEVTGSQRSKTADKRFSDAPIVSRRDVEFALTELQMFASCCYRFIENPEDFGLLVAQFTKAIAQIPYKLEKQEKHLQADWYMSGSNKDCVRVDKNGNGLQRLWQQQLTVLPLASLETAEAILAKYPTLSCLMEAYDTCASENEKKWMLQDIPIRRAAGPLANARRLGPEFSKKIYTFFNMLQGDVRL